MKEPRFLRHPPIRDTVAVPEDAASGAGDGAEAPKSGLTDSSPTNNRAVRVIELWSFPLAPFLIGALQRREPARYPLQGCFCHDPAGPEEPANSLWCWCSRFEETV